MYLGIVRPYKDWYLWNQCWHPNTTGQIFQYAKNTVASIKIAAGQTDLEDQEAMYKWAARSGDMRLVEHMIKAASSEREVAITPNQLDSDLMALPCNNGYIDLRSGLLNAHDPTKLYTRLSNATFDPSARSSLWEKFIDDITDGDKELQRYLQKCTGYTLTGATTEKVLFFLYGPPDTGKSTFIEAVKAILGPYCATADIVSFLRSHNQSPNQHRSDLTRLNGTRMVCVSEIRQDQQLDEATIKRMTGDDTIIARGAYAAESLEYVPTFKIWFAANDRPYARGTDEGFWSRLRFIPFLHQVLRRTSQQDLKTIFEQNFTVTCRVRFLTGHSKVVSCWQKEGLKTPQCVMQAWKLSYGDGSYA